MSRKRTTIAATIGGLAILAPLLLTGQAGATGTQEEGVTAAGEHGWGKALVQEDNFDGTELDAKWNAYDGPGHGGNGVRSPEAISVNDGIMTITGDPNGTSGGMAWDNGQQYGRWEARVQLPAGSAAYHPVLILWPDAEDFPVGGEVDYMEVFDPARQEANFFLHFGENNDQVTSSTPVDLTQWHNFAVEWTPDHIVGYVDGKEFFRSEDKSQLPPRPMHQTIQLDYFPEDGQASQTTMNVDWVRQYSL